MSFSEWKEVKLVDITSKITKGTTPTTIGASFVESGVNYIKSECITASRLLDRSKYVYITEETHEKLKRSQIAINDILFSMAGMFLGKTGIVFEHDIPANTNQAVAIIRVVNELADYKYIYYYLSQKIVQDYVNGSTSQSAQPNINLKQIGDINIKIPPLPEQKAIADTLSCLDDKIELNNNINKTLEEMAQAIFKSWFVDFEPFQDGEFEESELGRIPKGWKNGKIFDMGTVLTGKTPPTSKKEFYGNDIPFIKTPDMHGNIYITTVENKLSLRGAEYQNNKYIPKNSVIMSCIGAKAGVVSLTSELSQTNQQINAIISEWPYYVYYTLKMESDNLRNIGSSGSTMININKSTFENYKILIPSQSILKNFNEKVQPIFEMILNNQNQNRNLEILRDSLLPKLMSGEIRVPIEEVQ